MVFLNVHIAAPDATKTRATIGFALYHVTINQAPTNVISKPPIA
jgi:hypothetical protein